MLTVTVVQHRNLGINSLLIIHHILGKFNSFVHVRLARRVLRNYQCGPRPKKFGDPGVECQRPFFQITARQRRSHST